MKGMVDWKDEMKRKNERKIDGVEREMAERFIQEERRKKMRSEGNDEQSNRFT